MKPILGPLLAVLLGTSIYSGVARYGLHLPLEDIAKEAALVAGLIASVAAIWSKGISPVVKHANKVSTLIDEVGKVVDYHKRVDMDSLAAQVAWLVKDLRPNSGSSLRDAINRIEARLILIERTSDALHQDGPAALFRCTPEGYNIDVNRTYCRLMKCTKDELLGYGWRNFLTGKSARDDYDDTWKDSFRDGRELDFTIEFQATDGSLVPLLIHAYPISDSSGKVVQYLGLMELDYYSDDD